MTKKKALSAAAAFATPVLAQEVGTTIGSRSYRPIYSNEWNFHGRYSGSTLEDFGFTGRDRSRPGGWDPDLNGGTGS